MNDIFPDEFYEETKNIISKEKPLDSQEIESIIVEEKRKLANCTTKNQLRTLCVQLIAENLTLKKRLNSIANLVEERLNYE